jgi:hypothetical protein
MKDLKYYQDWYNKWIRMFRYLCDKCEQTYKVKYLIEEVRKHFWQIEWRLILFKHYGVNASASDMWPVTLRR